MWPSVSYLASSGTLAELFHFFLFASAVSEKMLCIVERGAEKHKHTCADFVLFVPVVVYVKFSQNTQEQALAMSLAYVDRTSTCKCRALAVARFTAHRNVNVPEPSPKCPNKWAHIRHMLAAWLTYSHSQHVRRSAPTEPN